jgi:hypothetical protein
MEKVLYLRGKDCCYLEFRGGSPRELGGIFDIEISVAEIVWKRWCGPHC